MLEIFDVQLLLAQRCLAIAFTLKANYYLHLGLLSFIRFVGLNVLLSTYWGKMN